MPMKLLSADDFRSGAKDGHAPDGTVFRFATTEPQAVGDDTSRTQRFVFSDATIDHAGDSIDPKGWDTSIFKRNPVALFSHMSWDPPIGRASNVSVMNDQLVGDIEFASADVYEFADTIFRLVKGGFLNAVSVGFKPKEWAFTSDKNRPYGIDFKKQTLLEISVCAVPCNPAALGEARSAGIDTAPLREWAEKVLDSGDTVFLPRKDLEALRSQAAGGEAPRYYISGDREVSAKGLERMRESFKRWSEDPNELLILEPGCTIRSVGAEHRSADDWKCGAATSLPIDEDGTWDGPAAEASLFEHAGGDDFDPAIACKGFLAYDASAPKLRGSYKLPFAHVDGGELKAMASGIHAAASRLPQTDIPDSVKTSARTVLDHYEAAMKPDDKAIEVHLHEMEAAGFAKAVAAVRKAGRRISAATKAKMKAASDIHDAYHDAMTKSFADMMDEPDDEPDGDPDDPPMVEAVGDDIPDDLSPQERRLKEAQALKASLPADD